MPYGYFLLIILCLPFLASLVTALAGAAKRKRTTRIMTATAGICLGLTLILYPEIEAGHVIREVIPWVPSLGVDFVLRLDGLTWLFMMLIAGIGVLVGIYAAYYMPRELPLVRFFSLLLAFMGSMLGIVLAGNVIQLVFFWELTSLFSFLLIGYWHQGESARDAARTALIVTVSGGLCLLAGVLLLGRICGSYDLDVILASGNLVRQSPLYLPTLILILVGVFAKSAQFPLHFWLPQAMSAPTPVSAYLHSATMVKAGVFLLLRLWPVLAGTEAWFWLVGGAGLVTLLIGAWAATFQQDLKAILAYSTISHLGLITMLVGLGSTLGAVAAIFHIVNHATFKASLFMAAGAVDNETGTRDLRRLGGLVHVMPITTMLAVIAGAAMAGVPLLNGFLSKEMFFSVALGTSHGLLVQGVTVIMAVAASALGVTYSLRLLVGAFFGPLRTDYPRTPHEPPLWMRFPIGALALACLAVGIFPAHVIGPSLHWAAESVLGAQTPEYSLAIWHGVTRPLLMSIVAFTVGCAVYFVMCKRFLRWEAVPFINRLDARVMFERSLIFLTAGLPTLARHFFPAKRLQVQLRIMVLLAVVAAFLSVTGLSGSFSLPGTRVDPAFVLLWLLGAGCAIGAASQARFHRLAALIFSGGAGLVVCLTFAWLSAPDLAVTQLLVESVTTILLLLGLRWLPKRIPGLTTVTRKARQRRRRDAVIAIGSGSGLALLAYATMLHKVPFSVSDFFLHQAMPGGGGHNVVNVILVDFRGFDTLGEITVLATAALTVFALLRRFRPASESLSTPAQQQRDVRRAEPTEGGVLALEGQIVVKDLAMPALLVRLMTPIIMLFGVHLFLRGHDLPGGGFVAGLTVTLALTVLYMLQGARWVEARLRVAPMRWIGFGLLLAIATGAGAMVAGYPFLTSHVWHVAVPLLGTWSIPSAIFFDLGVFAVVIGATSLILVVLAHQSLRRPIHVPTPETEVEAAG